MTKTLLLHVGPHKTGSTAVQRALTDSRPALQRQGWSYPDIGYSYLGHHEFAAALQPQQRAALAPLVAAMAALPQNIVLSSENFSRVGTEGWARLRDLLAGRYRLRAVYMLRNPLGLLFSSWQEAVKHGSVEQLPDYLLSHIAAPFTSSVLNPDLCLDPLAEVFGREAIEIHSYEKAVAGTGGLVQHFFAEVLGVAPPGELRRYADINKSFDTVAVEVIRLLSRAGLPAVPLMLENAELKALVRDLAASSSGFLRSIPIRLDAFVLGTMERRLLERWQDRLRFACAAPQIHEQRARSFEFLDPSIWLMRRDLAERFARFIAERAAAPQPPR
jgi:hypothetical protein